MMMSTSLRLIVSSLLAGTLATAAHAQPVFDSGSDGSDNAFTATNEPFLITKPVYNFTTITVPEGVTLSFAPQQGTNYPVDFRATSDVTISGTISVSGQDGASPEAPAPAAALGGPGGWQGGLGGTQSESSADDSARVTWGLGPGGASHTTFDNNPGFGAGYGTLAGSGRGPIYGNTLIEPLQGGSGGSGATARTSVNPIMPGGSGGGGGGAIRIAASGTITIDGGSIIADGGVGGSGPDDSSGSGFAGGSGSGGAIKLVANSIQLLNDASLSARGGARPAFLSREAGGDGRIRLEAFTLPTGDGFTITPRAATGVPIPIAETPDVPRINFVSIDGVNVSNPGGVPNVPDVQINDSDPVDVAISTTGIPAGTDIRIVARALNGPSELATVTNLSGTADNATGSVTMTIPYGYSQLTATATFEPTRKIVSQSGDVVTEVEVEVSSTGERKTWYTYESGERQLVQ